MRISLLATLAFLALSHAGYLNGITDMWSFDVGTFDHSDWMKTIDDNVPLSMLSIPGTHHSMTNRIKRSSIQTQNAILIQQLSGGIRYIDITCRYINDDMKVYKGRFDTGYSLKDVLITLFDFLNNHPHEAIILRIRKGGILDDSRTFLKSMEEHLLPGSEFGDRAFQHIFLGNNNMPTIGEVRGKVLILQDFNTSPPSSYGILWNSPAISSYSPQFEPGNLLLRFKWSGVKSHISKSLSEDYNKLRITHMTASAGFKPINIAAKSRPGLGMNGYLGRYLIYHKGNCFGIIVMDFPGYDLVYEILKLNQQYQVPGPNIFAFSRTSSESSSGSDDDEVYGYDVVSDHEGPPAETSDDENSDDEDVPAFIR